MNITEDFRQVYTVWVNGYRFGDEGQQFPLESNIETGWTTDFKKATKDYFKAKGVQEYERGTGYKLFDAFTVILFSIDININEFKSKFRVDFDIKDENCIEYIPYYCDYDFNTVAQRYVNF